MGKKELIDIHILEILEEHASEKKKMTQERLMYYLENEYNIIVTRRTLARHLKNLRDEHYIVGNRGFYKVNKFSDMELRLLIDGVVFGKHIPELQAVDIINKLKSMSNASLEKRVKHIHYLSEIQHTDNEKLYFILDVLDEAIEYNKKVEITQCTYNTKGDFVENGIRIISPYYIVPSKSMYYLICYAGRNGDIENRRIDRISSVKILEENRTQIKELPRYENQIFNLPKYVKEHIYMFSGECGRIVLDVKKCAIGDVIDWYGKDYRILSENQEYIRIRIYANYNAVYYWAMQYGGYAEVIEPEILRSRIIQGLRDILDKYKG